MFLPNCPKLRQITKWPAVTKNLTIFKTLRKVKSLEKLSSFFHFNPTLTWWDRRKAWQKVNCFEIGPSLPTYKEAERAKCRDGQCGCGRAVYSQVVQTLTETVTECSSLLSLPLRPVAVWLCSWSTSQLSTVLPFSLTQLLATTLSFLSP